ncbi:class I SAM-dependent methyltransferase [Nocardia abscessus]|uniref:class I SAM-dependent methyltransferase n=1 Tax=Nocardia abscessus TaxID=120957 RepID=UPI003CC7D9F2
MGSTPRCGVTRGLGRLLVVASLSGRGKGVLHAAAVSGNAATPAAESGANVVASDLTPELFEAGRRIAAAKGVDLHWQEADAEALPYADAEFDAVISCVGVMFAPFHQAAADELVRVTKPGGTIGLISWTPTGFIGQMFAAMKPFAPPPPPGAQPPPLWGDETHVRSLLGDRVADLELRRENAVIDRFADAAEFRDFFKTYYGPTVAVYKSIAGEPDKITQLDGALADLAARYDMGNGRMEWEYLLVTARRSA